jgi:hypothetical protein
MAKIVSGFMSAEWLVKQIHKQMQPALAKMATELGGSIKMLLHKYVAKNWYSAMKPTSYERTFQFIDSLSVDIKPNERQGYDILVFFDSDKIDSIERDSGQWNAHMSVDGSTSYGGKSIGDLLVEFIEFGQYSPLYSYDGIHMIENTKKRLKTKKDHIKIINRVLRRYGFKTLRI